MSNLTTRKIVLGLLMTLVLAFGIQDVADALRFTSPITRRDSTDPHVYTGDPFEIQFSVALVGEDEKDPTTTEGSATDISYASESSTRPVVSVTIIVDTGYNPGYTHYTVRSGVTTPTPGVGLTTQTRTWTDDSAATGAIKGSATDISYASESSTRPVVSATITVDAAGYAATNTHYTVSTITEETTIPGVRLTTHTRTWMTEGEAYYYNEEAVEINPGNNIRILSINGYRISHTAGDPFVLNEDEEWAWHYYI